MIDVHEDIVALVAAMKRERIVARWSPAASPPTPPPPPPPFAPAPREFIPLPPDPELIAAVLAAVADDDRPLIAQDLGDDARSRRSPTRSRHPTPRS